MDKSKNDIGEWPFPWDPYQELRKGTSPPALTEDSPATTKRSTLPPAPTTTEPASAPVASRWTSLAAGSFRAENDSSPSASGLRSGPRGPSSETRRKLELPWQDDSAPPTHIGIEPPAAGSRRRSAVWVAAIVMAMGLLVFATLQLPSFAMSDKARDANTDLLKSGPAALGGDGVKPPSGVALATCAGPGASVSEALPPRSGEASGEATAANVQMAKTTTGKGTKSSTEKSSRVKPTAAEPPAPGRVVSAEQEPVYPDPEPVAPKTPAPLAIEGEIFNRPPMSSN